MQDAEDAVVTHARQRDGVSSQYVRHDLATLRLVQLVGQSLLEHEHRRVLSINQPNDIVTPRVGHGSGVPVGRAGSPRVGPVTKMTKFSGSADRVSKIFYLFSYCVSFCTNHHSNAVASATR